MIRQFLFLAAVMPAAAIAQDGPTFDCSKATHEAEIAICEDPGLAALDRMLADRYAEALDAATSLDAGADDAVAELKAYQRGWIGGRDECWKTDDLNGCIHDAYLQRDAELVAQWMLMKPTQVSTWMCGDDGRMEVVTYFFDTGLPSVRFEIGDTIDVGTLSRTASGAKYDGSFGRSIWLKGDEAMYHEASPNDADFSCKLAG